MLTVKEVCGRLNVSKYTVYRLIHNGSLPAVKVNGSRNRYLVDGEDLAAYQSGDHLVRPLDERVDDPILTAAEAARRLRCSRDTIRRLAASGELRAHRFAGRSSHLRIPESAIREYLDANLAVSA